MTWTTTLTGELDTSQINTRQDGTLVVVVTDTAQDITLAITISPDGC